MTLLSHSSFSITILLLSNAMPSHGHELLRGSLPFPDDGTSLIDTDTNWQLEEISSDHKCGGAVNTSRNPNEECQQYLWDPTGDATMPCFSYGGSNDPCSLNIKNDVDDDGIYKDPSLCLGDTFYLWDEPDTQGLSYAWAGKTWLEYSQRYAKELNQMKSRGTKITSPLVKAGGSGVIQSNMQTFLSACGPACTNPDDPAYIDVIAINRLLWPLELPFARLPWRSQLHLRQAVSTSDAINNLPVYVTNWSRIGTTNPDDQVDAIEAVDEFFPTPDSVIKRVYWFGATDCCGGAGNAGYLTNTLSDGRTLGQVWRSKCDSI